MAYKHGNYGGYLEYRYGPRKKPTLANVMNKEKRRHLIHDVMDAVTDWRETPFEKEGALRAGLRSGLCLKGESWSVADDEAAYALSQAFMKIGVARPTWEQGQREYVTPSENCNWCGVELDETQLTRRQRFCDASCAKSALQYRDWERGQRESSLAVLASRMIRRSRNPAINCGYCAKPFHPTNTGGEKCCSKFCADKLKIMEERTCANPRCRKVYPKSQGGEHFCSAKCRKAHGRFIRDISFTCEQCSKPFTASRPDARFCSSTCKDQHASDREAIAAGRTPRRVNDPIIRCCEFCDGRFETTSPKALYCSLTCRNMLQRMRTGGWVPTKINRPLFDHLFSKPIDAAIRNQRIAARLGAKLVVPMHMLTAEVFDGWFRRAA